MVLLTFFFIISAIPGCSTKISIFHVVKYILTLTVLYKLPHFYFFHGSQTDYKLAVNYMHVSLSSLTTRHGGCHL